MDVITPTELRQCSRCKKYNPLDQYRSKIMKGLTKMCQSCRTSSNGYNNKRYVEIKSIPAVDNKKKCPKCLATQPISEFISMLNTFETIHCRRCRDTALEYNYLLSIRK